MTKEHGSVRPHEELFDFAVGFSRQPLPTGNRFAIVTNAGGPGIKATDATIRYGLELAKLRPETLESLKAKLLPTANVFLPVVHDGIISTTENARAGFEKITNGVKQKLPGVRRLGVGLSAPNRHSSREAARVANVPSVLFSRAFP